jgi:hypothetical protein
LIEVLVSDVNRVPYSPKAISDKVFEIDQPGKWWVEVSVNDFDKRIWGRKTIVLDFNGVKPPGPSPTPPGPKPPEPQPDPTPDALPPIEGQGLRVLFVVESSESIKLSKAQQQILYGKKSRDYLNANCVKGDDGKTPDWRILDPDTQHKDASNRFAKALARPRSSMPWVLISNGTTGYEGPIPEHEEEFFLLVDSFVRSNKSAGYSVTMLSVPNCGYCNAFKQTEKSKLLVPFSEGSGYARIYPTFNLIRNGQVVKQLEGYQTADVINKEIRQLEVKQ